MNDIELFLQLPITAKGAVICIVACASGLLLILLTAPRRNCFFFRWRPETRFLALWFSPTLLILWPVIGYWWFLKSRGIDPDAADFFEDD